MTGRIILFWGLLLVLLAGIAAPAIAQNGPRNDREARLRLDECDTLMSVTISRMGNTIRLAWWCVPGITEWGVYRSSQADFANAQLVAVVEDTCAWLEDPVVLATTARSFYYVTARWMQGEPSNYTVIEDFETAVTLVSYSTDEDDEPNGWGYDVDNYPDNPGRSLEMTGNTWKMQVIDTMRLDAGSVWQVLAKTITPGETQAFGIADSANEMWYVFWGTEIRRSGAWNINYQGWYPEVTWSAVDLSVGEDWVGRFGYYPAITRLLYANDNDGAHANGIFRIDEIRDISGTISLPPVARFRWEILSYPHPDTMEVRFCAMGCDPDGPLYEQLWSFGDGTISFETAPTHRYAAGGAYKAALLVTDTVGHADWVIHEVRDTTFTASREFRMLFGGDVMMARRYEDAGGIIQTWGVDSIFGRIRPIVSSVDLAMCNLECPLTNYTQHHPTKMFYFKGRPEYVSGLEFAGFDFVSLANNHTFDYMEPGMVETEHVLDSVLILNTGSGRNDELARAPAFYSMNGLCVAILGFCNRDGSWDNEQPFMAASPSRPGFAMWDRANMELAINAVRDDADIVIVQVHSGIEYATTPPGLRSFDGVLEDEPVPTFDLLPDTSDMQLRKFAIELGADIVINHHPHVIEGLEVYDGKLIAHSMGNFAFEQRFPETFITMAITSQVSQEGGAADFWVHPIYIDRYIPTPASGELARAIADYLSSLSRPLNTWVVRPPTADTAFVVMDTNAVVRQTEDSVVTLTMENRDGFAFSAPTFLTWEGYLTEATVTAPAGSLIRVGRDLLFYGNMEPEGATQWDLNSTYERYDNMVIHRGARSLRLNRAGGGNNSVSTALIFRQPYNPNFDHSVTAWINGQNTREERFEFQYWEYRSGGDMLDSLLLGGLREGNYAWTNFWQDLLPPNNTWWFNIKVNLRAPEAGEGRVWYDDVAVIEWEPWQASTVDVPFPTNNRYIQVRAPEGTPTVTVSYTMEWIDPPTDLPNRRYSNKR